MWYKAIGEFKFKILFSYFLWMLLDMDNIEILVMVPVFFIWDPLYQEKVFLEWLVKLDLLWQLGLSAPEVTVHLQLYKANWYHLYNLIWTNTIIQCVIVVSRGNYMIKHSNYYTCCSWIDSAWNRFLGADSTISTFSWHTWVSRELDLDVYKLYHYRKSYNRKADQQFECLYASVENFLDTFDNEYHYCSKIIYF